MPAIIVGPVLGLESDTQYTICFSTARDASTPVIHVTDRMVPNGDPITCKAVAKTPSSVIWRAVLTVPTDNRNRKVSYQIFLDGSVALCQNSRKKWEFFAPAIGTIPKFAYASCNGFSSLDLMHKTEDPYCLWKRMGKSHKKEPLSVLLMGGDQLYGDSIWQQVEELSAWNKLDRKAKQKYEVAKPLKDAIDQFYDQLYRDRWSDPDMSFMLASVPSLMMWDDHDIFDGWGSHPEEMQKCPVFQAIFDAAKRYFEWFQIRSKKNDSLLDQSASHYAFGLNFRGYHILALDNRTERTVDQVMSPGQWTSVNQYLAERANDGHLLVLSAVPVVYRDFSLVETAYEVTPWEEELTDDLRDHWRATAHEGERARLIQRLLTNAKRRNAAAESEVPQNESAETSDQQEALNTVSAYKTVILSGDVHIGCIGAINDKARQCKIHQVVSSGIVHPAPSRIQWLGIMAVTNDRDEFLDEDRSIHISMLRPFGSSQYIRRRNYITLLMGSDEKLWVNWESEGGEKPYYPIQ